MTKYINNINGVEVPFTEAEITARKAEEAEATNATSKLKTIKEIRLQKLKDTDWWVLRGNMTDAQTQYRQKLRDIPADYDSSKYDDLLTRDSDGNLTHSVWTKP
jgi:hypothetical protein|tara:strand:+ start:286 stop:597 length:312 start_codon:yes stop_codon:yes gene_type:complete